MRRESTAADTAGHGDHGEWRATRVSSWRVHLRAGQALGGSRDVPKSTRWKRQCGWLRKHHRADRAECGCLQEAPGWRHSQGFQTQTVLRGTRHGGTGCLGFSASTEFSNSSETALAYVPWSSLLLQQTPPCSGLHGRSRLRAAR